MTHSLKLDLPDDARTTLAENYVSVSFPEPWFRIELDGPSAPPDDLRQWLAEAVTSRCPADATVRIVGSIRGRSTLGWPLEVVHAVVVEGARIIEHRLVGLYEMLGYAASVTARAFDAERFSAAMLPMLLPMVASARPVWRSRFPVALAEMWSLSVSRPSD